MIHALLLLAGLAAAVPPDSTDAAAIMRAVEDRPLGDRALFTLEMVITDDNGRSRSREVTVRSLRTPQGRKELLLFASPADLRGAGLLSHDYDDGARTDDQWLYLPSLGRSVRIAGSDRSSSFMGSDLTYADMTKTDPDDYDYALLDASADVDGAACWIVEARPRSDRVRDDTGYLKVQVWVDKQRMVPLQSKAWVIAGRRVKYTQFQDWRQVDGIWVAHRVIVRTVRGGEVESTTTLVTSGARFDQDDVTEADFTQHRLEQGL